MKCFRLLVLTPRERVYDGEILSLVVPTGDGAVGFLAGREATLSEIVPGSVRFRTEKGEEVLETDGGVMEMTGKEATLLCGAAYYEAEAEERRKARDVELTEEKKRQEQSLAEYKMTRAALMRAFEKFKRNQTKI